jgi:hypothetical protein
MHAMLFAAFFAALYAAHEIGDHWVQTQHQADHKHEPGRSGWYALIGHVATYTTTAAVALALVIWRCDIHVDATTGYRILAGLAISAITHGWADRRHTLAWLAHKIGSGPFYQVKSGGISGSYLLDRSFHIGWLAIAALVMA